MFHITFVQIVVFDWLLGRHKGSIFVKMFKNLLLRNHKEDEAETWHTCLGHYPLQKLCFLFRSDKNSGCYGNLVSIDFIIIIISVLEPVFLYRGLGFLTSLPRRPPLHSERF